MEKEFFITSTISVMAENREEVAERIEEERHNENEQSEMAYDLLANAEIDEAELEDELEGATDLEEKETILEKD